MKQTIDAIWNKSKIIISGPCSAETEEQLLSTAEQLHKTKKVDVLRAGIWKPRTKPGGFEGIGEQGLHWMQEARKRTGLPIAVEVANQKQTEDALNHGVDILWIGARTTVNPFSIQEIADTLRGIDVPVLIKNPVNPDIELWTGAIERFQKAGISRVGLIHRGFTSYANVQYRNAPMWHLAVEMKMRHPDLIMICDPSHICGRRDILSLVAQQAIDLEYNGLMIECHIDPDNAWSDAKQQITPDQVNDMLDHLMWRKEKADTKDTTHQLHQLREQIDQLDDELFQILDKRLQVVEKIGKYKKDNNLTILQSGRWSEVIEKAKARSSKSQKLNPKFIERILDVIHIESINLQNEILNSK